MSRGAKHAWTRDHLPIEDFQPTIAFVTTAFSCVNSHSRVNLKRSLVINVKKTYHDLNVVKDDTADKPDSGSNTSICRDWDVGTNLSVAKTEWVVIKRLLQQWTKPGVTYLCSWVYFCRRMYENITSHYGTLCSISTSQHLWWGQPELRKIEFRAPQRHSAKKGNSEVRDIEIPCFSCCLSPCKRLKEMNENTKGIPRRFNLLPEIHSLVSI